MVPAFALIGTGPEGFRKAFLAYKSKELARHIRAGEALQERNGWQIFIDQTPDLSAADQARQQVEMLRQKIALKQ